MATAPKARREPRLNPSERIVREGGRDVIEYHNRRLDITYRVPAEWPRRRSAGE